MKLTRKGSPSVIDRDTAVKRKLKFKLNRVSETIRAQEVKAGAQAKPPLARTPDAPPSVSGPAPNNLTLNLRRKGKTVDSSSAVALQNPEEETAKKWKARAFFGRHLAILQCNNCSMSRVCPKFKAGYECAFLPFLNSHRVETATDLVRYMKQMVENSMRRAQLISMVEAASGGMPSIEASESLDTAFRQLKELHSVVTEKVDEEIEMEGDATVVGQIFGGMKAKRLLDDTIEMKRNDPLLNLPLVPDTEQLPGHVKDMDVSAELVRDAILGAGAKRKDLKSPQEASIHSGELS